MTETACREEYGFEKVTSCIRRVGFCLGGDERCCDGERGAEAL